MSTTGNAPENEPTPRPVEDDARTEDGKTISEAPGGANLGGEGADNLGSDGDYGGQQSEDASSDTTSDPQDLDPASSTEE